MGGATGQWCLPRVFTEPSRVPAIQQMQYMCGAELQVQVNSVIGIRSDCSASHIAAHGTSLVVQWLRRCTPSAGAMGSSPARGTKIPHATQYGLKKRKKSKSAEKLVRTDPPCPRSSDSVGPQWEESEFFIITSHSFLDLLLRVQ